MTPGWLLEPAGNVGPRGMVAIHRTRLTDLSAGRALSRWPKFPGNDATWTAGRVRHPGARAWYRAPGSHGPAFTRARDRERAVARAARSGIAGGDRGHRALGVLDPRGAVGGGARVS